MRGTEKNDFQASQGWLTRFKNRYQLRSCSIQGEKLSEDFESAVEFVETLRLKMIDNNFQLYQIYNADESGLFWRVLSATTYISKEEKMHQDLSNLKIGLVLWYVRMLMDPTKYHYI